MKRGLTIVSKWAPTVFIVLICGLVIESVIVGEWARAAFFQIWLIGDGLRAEIRRRKVELHVNVDTVLKARPAEGRSR